MRRVEITMLVDIADDATVGEVATDAAEAAQHMEKEAKKGGFPLEVMGVMVVPVFEEEV